jgi:predicted nucleotidyltransferase
MKFSKSLPSTVLTKCVSSALWHEVALIQELEELLSVKVDVVSDRGLRERIRDRVLNEAVAL